MLNQDEDRIWNRLLNNYLDRTFTEYDLEKEADRADYLIKQQKEEAAIRALDKGMD